MKTSFLIVLLIGLTSFPKGNLIAIRAAFVQASLSETNTLKLLQLAEEGIATSPVFTGYKAAATMMMAKFTINPISKLQHFNNGKEMLEDAIKKHPTEIELNFIRYTIQCNAPYMLNYQFAIQSDKQILLTKLKTLKDQDLKQHITKYLKTSPYLTPSERAQLN
jgi:hypothetical protein